MLISWAFLQCFPRTYWEEKACFGLFLFFNQGITLG
jgi:hypothetical protein